MATLIRNGRTIVVPDDSIEFYTDKGWSTPGAPAAPVAEPVTEIPDGEPSEIWTVKQLTALAERDTIDLAGATRKADILAAIAGASS